MLNTKFLAEKQNYDGSQLAPLWIYRRTGLCGDTLLSFVGEAKVREHLVDEVDRLNGDYIYSAEMLHFLLEHFDVGLAEGIVRQRLLMAIIKDIINEKLSNQDSQYRLRRQGDDLYAGEQKFSVSIATSGVISTLIHIGLNIDAQGAPVKACGLKELLPSCSAQEIATELGRCYQAEHQQMLLARCKVRPRL